MSDLTYDFNESTAFTVAGRNVAITKSHFSNNVEFGIAAVAGAENSRFDENTIGTKGIEFAGSVHCAKNGEIADNTFDGTSDNCISVSGDKVKVIGNTLRNCLGHGVGVYGSNNKIVGNRISDAGHCLGEAGHVPERHVEGDLPKSCLFPGALRRYKDRQ